MDTNILFDFADARMYVRIYKDSLGILFHARKFADFTSRLGCFIAMSCDCPSDKET